MAARKGFLLLVAALGMLLAGCVRGMTPPPPPATAAPTASPPTATPTMAVSPTPVPTVEVVTVEPRITTLAAPLDRREAELSGLAWHGDDLVLLPQYPTRFGDRLFTLPREAVEAFAATGAALPDPDPVPFDDGGLHTLRGFEGFEAIAFDGDDLYLTIEAHKGETMLGYLVRGHWEEEGIVLDADSLATMLPQVNLENMSEEALVLVEGTLFVFDEANGPAINPAPLAQRFAVPTLAALDPWPMLPLDYRVTDATAIDDEGCFWVIDYLWPGDAEKLKPAGPSDRPIERLVPLRAADERIERCPAPTLALVTAEDGKARNWEGAVRLPGEGFVLVTDTYPQTLLAFVPDAP